MKNVLIALLLLVVVASITRAGLPMAHRMEEYIAFVLVTDFSHEVLADQAKQLGEWTESSGLWESVRTVWERLLGLFGRGGEPATPVVGSIHTEG